LDIFQKIWAPLRKHYTPTRVSSWYGPAIRPW